MRSSCWWVLGFVTLAVPARGDDPKAAPVSLVQSKLDAAQAVKERLTAELVQGYEQVKAENLADPARTSREEAFERRYWAGIKPAIDDLLAASGQHPDDLAAVEALAFVTTSARGLADEPRQALVLLARNHVQAPNISTATRTVFVHHDKPEAIALLRAALAANPSRTERGRVCNDLAWTLCFSAKRIERLRAGSSPDPLASIPRDTDPVALKREAEALYDRCVAEFADVPVVGYGDGKTVGDFARGALFDLRHLQVGQTAPEITGDDIDGQPLKLSDHRGKVVVLVFSGEWCGPCHEAAKHFRDLLKPEARQSNPCVVLEVNTDATRDPVRKAIAAGEIVWPCWFDGGTAGPITMAWGVASFPTIYVLDQDGVIRAKDIRGEATAAAVARLGATPPRRPEP